MRFFGLCLKLLCQSVQVEILWLIMVNKSFGSFTLRINRWSFFLLFFTDSLGVYLIVLSCSQSAWDMLHEEVVFGRITTSCAELDEILGGGISCKQVTEIGLHFSI